MNVLRITCIDKPGIVAAVATCLANNHCNIEESSQFYDPQSGKFFMRVVFRALAEGCLQAFKNCFAQTAKTFKMEYDICNLDAPVRTIIMVSKADHCLHHLLYQIRTKTLPLHIAGILSNHIDLKPLADDAGIAFHHLPIGHDKAAQEAQIQKIAADENIDLILLARYMQVLSPDFCSKFYGRVINIHHSFLPGFKGAKPYHQAYDRGVKIIGATAHFATPDLDEGPIISQDVEPVTHSYFPDKLQQIGRDIESRVLTKATHLFCERRIFINQNRTIIL